MRIEKISPQGRLYSLITVCNDRSKTEIKHKDKSIIVDCTVDNLVVRWFNWVSGMHVQLAFDNLSAAEREFLISGYTEDEWKALFASNKD